MTNTTIYSSKTKYDDEKYRHRQSHCHAVADVHRTNAVRNKYQSALDLGHDRDSAAVALWQEFCMSIKGYQGVPKDFKPYFTGNDQGREHAVSAVNFLLDQISFQKVELRQRQGQ